MALSNQARLLALTPVLVAASYTTGQILFNPTEIADAVFQQGRLAELRSIAGLDKDNLGAAFDLVFFQNACSLGSVGSAPNAVDATLAAAVPMGHRSIIAGDYAAAIGTSAKSLMHLVSPGLYLQAAEDSRSLWVAGIARGSFAIASTGAWALQLGVKWW